MHRCKEAWPLPHARLRASRRDESLARLRASRRPQRTKAIARVDKILLRVAHRSSSGKGQVTSGCCLLVNDGHILHGPSKYMLGEKSEGMQNGRCLLPTTGLGRGGSGT